MNPKDFNVPSGDDIRELRQEAGLTQKQLAQLADVSEGTVSHVESETHGSLPSLRNVLSGLELVYDIREKAIDDHRDEAWVEMENELLDEEAEDETEEEERGLGALFDGVDTDVTADD